MRRVFTASAVAVVMLTGSLFVASASNAAPGAQGTCTSSFTGPVGYQTMKKVVADQSGQDLTREGFATFDKNGDGQVCYKLSTSTNGNTTPNIIDDK
jgi:hypothetical protein